MVTATRLSFIAITMIAVIGVDVVSRGKDWISALSTPLWLSLHLRHSQKEPRGIYLPNLHFSLKMNLLY